MCLKMCFTWSNSEEPILRIDGPQYAILIELHPGDIISHTLHLVSRQRRGHHSQIGLATSGWKSSCDVPFSAFGICHSNNL